MMFNLTNKEGGSEPKRAAPLGNGKFKRLAPAHKRRGRDCDVTQAETDHCCSGSGPRRLWFRGAHQHIAGEKIAHENTC